jgi:RNA polymerase sigma factor (sigma-70 family)
VPPVEDRALVAAMVSGDPRGLDGAYRRYAPALRTYCVSLLGDADAAGDTVHDTFMLARERIVQLRDPDRLRPWLYAIARHECLRHRRGRARLTALDGVDDPAADTIDLTAAVHAEQVRELVHAAAAGLGADDRDLIELALRQGFAAADVAAVLGVSTNHAHARMSRARARLEAAIGVLLLARAGGAACPPLAALLDGWTGRLDPKLCKRLSRHVGRCAECGDRRGRLVHPAALLAAFTAGPALGAAGTWLFSPPDAGAPPLADDDPPGAGDVPEAPDAADARPVRPRRSAARRAAAGVAAAIVVFVAIAATLTRVADPEALAGDRREAAPPAQTAPPAPLATEDDPALKPGGSQQPTDGPRSSSSTSGSKKGGGTDGDTTKSDPDGGADFAITVNSFDLACAADGKTYVLSVRIIGSRPVSAAIAYWRPTAGGGTDKLSLGPVDRTTREGRRGSLRLPSIEWWVEATAVDGGHASTVKRTASNPCS